MILMTNKEIFELIEKNKVIINIWQSTETLVILGRFCSEKEDLKPITFKDKLKIVRRVGGGGTVILTDGVMIIEVGIIKDILKNHGVRNYFKFFNSLLTNSLKSLGIDADYDNEFYDITIKNKKLGGVSLAIRKNIILYGASILLKKQTIFTIERYLKEPIKQPKYRMKRNHKEFLVTIEDIIGSNKLEKFIKKFKKEFIRKSEVLINAINKS